jgi:hypothetical protein
VGPVHRALKPDFMGEHRKELLFEAIGFFRLDARGLCALQQLLTLRVRSTPLRHIAEDHLNGLTVAPKAPGLP